MTKTELIQMAERGERIHKQEGSLYDNEKPGLCMHRYRVIICNNEKDACECEYCGNQRVVNCNFDEEYA